MTSCAKACVDFKNLVWRSNSYRESQEAWNDPSSITKSSWLPLVKSEVEIVTQVSSFSHLFLTVRQKFSHAVFFQAHLLIVLQIVTKNFLFPPYYSTGWPFDWKLHKFALSKNILNFPLSASNTEEKKFCLYKSFLSFVVIHCKWRDKKMNNRGSTKS